MTDLVGWADGFVAGARYQADRQERLEREMRDYRPSLEEHERWDAENEATLREWRADSLDPSNDPAYYPHPAPEQEHEE